MIKSNPQRIWQEEVPSIHRSNPSSDCPSIHPFIHPSIQPSLYLSLYSSIHWTHGSCKIFVHLVGLGSVPPLTHPSIHPFTDQLKLPFRDSSIPLCCSPSTHPSAQPSIRLSLRLSIFPCFHLSIYLVTWSVIRIGIILDETHFDTPFSETAPLPVQTSASPQHIKMYNYTHRSTSNQKISCKRTSGI